VRNRIRLLHLITTLIPHEAELVEEALAGLAAIVADAIRRHGGDGVLVGKWLEGEGEWKTEVFFELLAIWPVRAS
jgi:hypothetical protein